MALKIFRNAAPNRGPSYSRHTVAGETTRARVVALQQHLLTDPDSLPAHRTILNDIARATTGLRDEKKKPVDLGHLTSTNAHLVVLALGTLASAPQGVSKNALPRLAQLASLRDIALPAGNPLPPPVGGESPLEIPDTVHERGRELLNANSMAAATAWMAGKGAHSTFWQHRAAAMARRTTRYAAGVHDRQPAADRDFVERALQSEMGVQDYQTYYNRRNTGWSDIAYPAATPFDGITNAALIAQFSVTGGVSMFGGRAHALALLRYFQSAVQMISIGHAQLGDPAAWHKMSAAASLSVLNYMGARLFVEYPERLETVKAMIAAGKKVIFYANHRSDLDTLVLCAMLRGCGIHNVVKDALVLTPGLSQTPVIHPEDPTRWHTDATLYTSIPTTRRRDSVEQMVRDCLTMLDQPGESVLINPGSTRHETPISGVERGMIPPRSGLMRLVTAAYQRYGRDVMLVPVGMAGVGSIMNNDYLRTARYGIGINRNIVMGIQETYSAEELAEAIAADPKSHILAAALYARSATGLFERQLYFNEWPG